MSDTDDVVSCDEECTILLWTSWWRLL